MTVVATLAALTGLLLCATADALDAFARSLVVQQETCPDVVPSWIDDGSASL